MYLPTWRRSPNSGEMIRYDTHFLARGILFMYLPAWRRSPCSGEVIRYGTDFLARVMFMYQPAFTQILEALAKQWRDDPVRYRFFWLWGFVHVPARLEALAK
jgi:hypothetical protein